VTGLKVGEVQRGHQQNERNFSLEQWENKSAVKYRAAEKVILCNYNTVNMWPLLYTY
jgi:hypothetical protein